MGVWRVPWGPIVITRLVCVRAHGRVEDRLDDRRRRRNEDAGITRLEHVAVAGGEEHIVSFVRDDA